MARKPKLPSTESASVKSVTEKEAKKVQFRSVELARAEKWSSEWCNLDQACTLSPKALVMTVVVEVKSLTRPTSARPAMARRS